MATALCQLAPFGSPTHSFAEPVLPAPATLRGRYATHTVPAPLRVVGAQGKIRSWPKLINSPHLAHKHTSTQSRKQRHRLVTHTSAGDSKFGSQDDAHLRHRREHTAGTRSPPKRGMPPGRSTLGLAWRLCGNGSRSTAEGLCVLRVYPNTTTAYKQINNCV